MVLRDVWGFRFPNTLLCLCAGMWMRSMRSPLPAVIQIFLKRRLLLDGERAMSFRKRSLFCNYKTSSIWWRTYLLYIYIFLTRISSKNLCKFELCVIWWQSLMIFQNSYIDEKLIADSPPDSISKIGWDDAIVFLDSLDRSFQHALKMLCPRVHPNANLLWSGTRDKIITTF